MIRYVVISSLFMFPFPLYRWLFSLHEIGRLHTMRRVLGVILEQRRDAREPPGAWLP